MAKNGHGDSSGMQKGYDNFAIVKYSIIVKTIK
jgi:hypothetical protein